MAENTQQTPQGPIGVTVLGSTGSIGVNTLDVIARHPDRYRVVALTAHHQLDRLLEQCRRFRPQYVVLSDEQQVANARRDIDAAGLDTQVLGGQAGLETVVALKETQQVMAAIVGAAGLRSTLAAARAGKRILLANKESLVMAGKIFMDEIQRCGAELLPIDSEHNAIFQCLPVKFAEGLNKVGVTRILLTASGGPFLNMPRAQLADVTPAQACDHPKWKMGRKISVDSATMMNKGLEVIEACWLFGASPEQIQVVIHPQSVIHSLVEYDDGSVLAQLGNPDMRTPIAHAMAWPERMSSGVERLNLVDIAQLEFAEPDLEQFPCLRLAFDAAVSGGTAPAILNAANEIAVQAFLEGKIAFTMIAQIIEQTLQDMTHVPVNDLDSVLAADQAGREYAQGLVSRLPGYIQ